MKSGFRFVALLVLVLALTPAVSQAAIQVNCEPTPIPTALNATTVFFVGGGPRVTSLEFVDPRLDGEAHFSMEADFVGSSPEQSYACSEKATTLSTMVMQAARELAPGAILVPVRVQNCQGELFRDTHGADIDMDAVAQWIKDNATTPSVVVFGFAKGAKTPPLGDFIRTLREAGIAVIPPANGRSEEALYATMLRAGREAGIYQSLLNVEKAATCTSNGGINQGGLTTGTYVSPKFPCGDTGAKSQAIQNLLQQMGYTQTLCSGTCTTGSCKPIGLTSGLQDNVDLVLNDDGQGTCWYVATVKPPGTGYFRATCDCVCATTTGTGSGSN